MLNTSFTPWPSVRESELLAVSEVLRSGKWNYWTGGIGRQFESAFAEYSESAYGIALANGTVALDVIWKCLNFGEGDEIIVTPRTFLASASSIINAGLKPVFVDVDQDSQNIDPDAVDAAITPRTKGILAVHLAGWSCEMIQLLDIADQAGAVVVEDCAQSHGGRYRGKSTGTWGQAAAWSFCQDKIMTTGGEGGMVTTSDENLWSDMWSYKDHGKSWEAVNNPSPKPGFRWLHESFGTNWRMTEMQAAIGLEQLNVMPDWTQSRQEYSHQIWDTAKTLHGLRVPVIPSHISHACYKCYVFIEPEALASGWSRDRIVAEIIKRGVPAYSGSCSEVYLESAFDSVDCRPSARLSVAKKLGETSLMFLVHPTLKQSEIDKTCSVLSDVMSLAK